MDLENAMNLGLYWTDANHLDETEVTPLCLTLTHSGPLPQGKVVKIHNNCHKILT